ncbi:MAG: hypothetical protein ACYDCL_13280 [Myxococcales bacterium]
MSDGRRSWSALDLAEWALLAAGLLLSAFVVPHALVGDDNMRHQMAVTLLDRHIFIPSRYSWVGPLLEVPFVALDRALHTGTAIVERFNSILFAAGLAGFFAVFRGSLPTATVRRFALLLTAASMFTYHLRHVGAETLTAMGVGLGLAAACGTRPVRGWLLALLAALNTPASIVGFGLASALRAVQLKRLRALGWGALFAVAYLGESWFRTGQLFHTGYEGDHGMRTVLPYSGRPGFSYPFFLGLLSIFLSFGKGLIFFCPGLLALRAKSFHRAPPVRDALVLWLGFLAGLVLVYAKWWSWYGGDTFGPRFFLFASLPACLALAVLLEDEERGLWAGALALLLLALSCWVGLVGAVFDTAGLGVCGQNGYAQEFLCWDVPEFSVLWHPLVETPKMASPAFAAYAVLVFLLLALPLLRRLASQAVATLRRLDLPSAWRL